MAQLEEAALEVPSLESEDLSSFLGIEDDIAAIEAEEGEAPSEGDEPDEETPNEDKPEVPAIDPPVSWGTDAKELFTQLPPELQAKVSEREAQREAFVNSKATEAATARRNAIVEAENAFADTQRQYATELAQYAKMLEPQRPNPNLVASDPAQFYALMAQYEAGVAHQQDMLKRAEYANYEAQHREQQALQVTLQEEAEILAKSVPDWNDADKRKAFLTNAESVGVELGFDPSDIQNASASELLALGKVAEMAVKARKWDDLQKSKMGVVRDAKVTKVSKPGVTPTRGEVGVQKSQAAWQNVKAAKSKEAKDAAFGDWLTASGHTSR